MARNNDGAGDPRKGMLETKAGFAKRRATETSDYMARKGSVPPSNDVDTQGRPVDPKRTKYGYRGHDPAREPMKQSVEDKRQWSRDPQYAESDRIRAKAEAKFAATKLGMVKPKR